MPRKLKTCGEVMGLHDAFCRITGYRIPLAYFLTADCYGLKKDGEYVAGFILRHGNLLHLRSFKEIPQEDRCEALSKIPVSYRGPDIADFTGYFLTDKKYGLRFTWFLVKSVFAHPARLFIYSYDTSNVRLGKYYSYGDPVRLYSGEPALLEGYTERQPPVNVEILTKWGILKIFMHRTAKMIFRRFRRYGP